MGHRFSWTRVPIPANLNDIKDLNVDEAVQDYPSITGGQIRAVLDFLVRSANPVLPQEITSAGCSG